MSTSAPSSFYVLFFLFLHAMSFVISASVSFAVEVSLVVESTWVLLVSPFWKKILGLELPGRGERHPDRR